jgi:DNA-binding beta-propeller fold protein YncE
VRTHLKTRFSLRCRKAGAATVATATALVTLAALAPTATADTGDTPDFVKTIGGSGRAEVYPSGLETTSDGVVLADTGNDRVVKYRNDGTVAWTHGVHGFGPTGINNPRDIGVDGAGRVWVADTGNTSIVRLSAAGAFQKRFRGPTGDQIKSPIGITAVGNEVIVADAGSLKIRVFNAETGAQTAAISQPSPAGACTFAELRDVTKDAAGNYYVANYTRNNILKLSPSGACLGAFGSAGTGELEFKNPYGVAIAGDLLYVADSNNNRVQVLTLDGQFRGIVGAQGGFGTDGTFSHLRRVAVASDGDVWAADLWGFTAQRFDRSGTDASPSWTHAQTIGKKAPGRTSTSLFNQPNGLDTDGAGNLYVADRMHHRYAKFGPDGQLKDFEICGDRGTVGIGFNWPADLAVDDETGQIWLADTHQNRLQVLDAGCTQTTSLGTEQFKFPAGIEIRGTGPGRLAFVVDSGNNRIVSYDVGSRTQVGASTTALGLKNPQGLGIDPVSGDLFVADKANNRVVRVRSTDGTSFTLVRDYTGLNKPEGASLDDQGRLYVADTAANQVVIMDAATGSVTGTITEPAYFEPQSVHFAGNTLYVSDTFNDRVQSYSWGSTPPPVDSAAPETAIAEPVKNSVVTSTGPVTISGSASDDVAVKTVEVGVRDRDTLLWWNATSGQFQAKLVRVPATLAAPGGKTTAWSYSFDAPAAIAAGATAGKFTANVRAVDTADKPDATVATSPFTVQAQAADTVAPETTLTSPANNSLQPKPVTIAGQATDAVGVAKVQVHVKDRDATNRYWNPGTGAWQTGIVWFDATVSSVGATSTGWTTSFSPPATTGRYWVAARAVDNAGNRDASPMGVNFQTTDARKLTYVKDFAKPAVADITPVDVLATPTHYYALDVARYRIVRINRSTGQIDAEVGGGRGNLPGELAAARSIARASNGDIYIADTPNNRVSVYSADLAFKFAFGSKGTGAEQFTQVYGLAIGQGRNAAGTMQELVYTIDGDGRIKKWNVNGGYIGAFATGVALNQPRMAEIHPVTNDLWVVNARDRQVVAIKADGQERFRFGRGGTADGQFMGDPRGLAINADGTRAYVSDEGNHRVQVFNAVDGPERGQHLMNIAPAQGSDDYFVDVRGIDVAADGTLVASDEWDFSIKEFNSATGAPAARSPLFGSEPQVGGVNTPRGLELDGNGHVFTSDWWNQRIARWNLDGSGAMAFGYRGTTDDPGSINFAWDIAVQPGTDRVFVANRESHEIEVFTTDGDYVTRWGTRGTTDGKLQFPQGVDFMPDDDGTGYDLVVADSANNRIQRFSIDGNGNGTWETTWGGKGTGAGQFSQPTGISVAPDGTIWVADTDNNRIQKRNPTTGAWTAYAKPTGGALTYRRPWGVTANSDGSAWVTDSGRGRVVLVNANGAQQLEANGNDMGAGALNQPFDTLVLPSGNLLISDAFNNRIIEVKP